MNDEAYKKEKRPFNDYFKLKKKQQTLKDKKRKLQSKIEICQKKAGYNPA